MSDTIKAVLVGCGGISNAWLTPLKSRADIELVGLVDLVEAAARKRAEEHGLHGAVIGSDLGQVLARVKPDVVFDCTIPEVHVKVALEAFSHGCHVYGEKPLADTMDNAVRMVTAAKESGKLGAVMQNRRFDRQVRRLRSFLASGEIGEVTTVHSRFLIGAHFGGFRDQMKHVLLLDMAIHTFDAARFLMQAEPYTALCHEWNPRASWYAHGASAVALFEMSDDIVYTYQGSWCSEGLNTSWESQWHVIGTEGSVSWDGGANMHAQKVVERGGFSSKLAEVEVPELEAAGALSGHAAGLDDFLNALKSGQTPETPYSDNIKSLAMVHGAIESAERGQRITIAST